MDIAMPVTKIVETPWMVFTQNRLDKGLPPFIIWAKTKKMLRYQFTRRYKISPVKIVPCHWDSEKGTYIADKVEILEKR